VYPRRKANVAEKDLPPECPGKEGRSSKRRKCIRWDPRKKKYSGLITSEREEEGRRTKHQKCSPLRKNRDKLRVRPDFKRKRDPRDGVNFSQKRTSDHANGADTESPEGYHPLGGRTDGRLAFGHKKPEKRRGGRARLKKTWLSCEEK